MAFIVGSIIIGGSMMLAGATVKGIEAFGQKKKSQIENARLRRLEKQYKILQDTRQAVIDQSDEIRSLKDQVYNPYANLGVAMQATNMKLEQSDEDLANILQSVNQAGAGGGAATQLARMASVSKAQAAAGLEQQELQNQQLRIQGEAQVMQQKLSIEQMALQEEVAAWGRQENRDIQDMNRVATLEGRANTRAMQHEQARSGLVQGIGQDFSNFGQQVLTMGIKGKMGGGGTPKGGTMGQASPDGGVYGPDGTPGWLDPADGNYDTYAQMANAMSQIHSDKKLKKNIKFIKKSLSGLNIYSFEYKNPKYGKGKYEGVMSDEVPIEFVIKDKDGYDMVDYSKLDVQFKELT